MDRVRLQMEEDVHFYDKTRDFYKFLPEHGSNVEDILAEAEQYFNMTETKHSRHPSQLVDEKHSELYSRIHKLFRGSDPTKANLFPGVRKMETEVIKMVSSMFHASSDSAGVVTIDTAESLLLACAGYRNRALRRGSLTPTIVTSETAHPVLDQAAKLFHMRIERIPCDNNGEFRSELVRCYCNDETAMIVISAPNRITGSMDQIEPIAEIAHGYKIPLHIDCSMGGFILPFMEHCDFSLPSFDFRLPGVSSISVDLRNYGESPSTCSILLYRDNSYLKEQSFVRGGGPEGMYWSSTINGSKEGSSVALTWATLLSHGRDGYLEVCENIVETTRKLAEMLLTIEGLCLHGSADLCLIAFSHEKVDIYDLVEIMIKKGWDVDPLVKPKAARVVITSSFCEDSMVEFFVRDVASAVIQLLGNAPDRKKSRLSFLYTLLGSVSDEKILEGVVYQRLLAQYSIISSTDRRNRTLSVEGRKMSFIAATEASKLVNEVKSRQEIMK